MSTPTQAYEFLSASTALPQAAPLPSGQRRGPASPFLAATYAPDSLHPLRAGPYSINDLLATRRVTQPDQPLTSLANPLHVIQQQCNLPVQQPSEPTTPAMPQAYNAASDFHRRFMLPPAAMQAALPRPDNTADFIAARHGLPPHPYDPLGRLRQNAAYQNALDGLHTTAPLAVNPLPSDRPSERLDSLLQLFQQWRARGGDLNSVLP